MYIAIIKTNQGTRYRLKHSVCQDGVWLARDILDLGDDPGAYLVYPGGNAFYVSEDVQDAVLKKRSDLDYDLLEDIFWPFVRGDIRLKIGPIRDREQSWRGPKKLPYDQEKTILEQIHPFDKRRLLYLKCGGIDLSRIDQVPLKIFHPLLSMSRDEIEQRFIWMEAELEQDEYREYVYASLNLQRFFTKPSARLLPQTVDQEDLETAFMETLCRLNRDAFFWQGFPTTPGLQDYLIRFAVMFFDYPFRHDSPWARRAREFMDSHRTHRDPVSRKPPVPTDELQELFGVPKDELLEMSKKELTRVFREKAMNHHPDHGGDPDSFIRLFAAYESLMLRVSKKK
jgi:hypothetical protein